MNRDLAGWRHGTATWATWGDLGRLGTAAVFKVNSSKVCLGGSRVPHLTGFQQGVQERKQLPNARKSLMTLKGLPIGFELGGKGFDDGIAALWTFTPIMDTHDDPIRPSRSPRTLRG